MKDLLFLPQQLPFSSDLNIEFHYYEIKARTFFEKENVNYNNIYFLLEGSLNVSYDGFSNVKINSMEFFMIPKLSDRSILSFENGRIIIVTFESFKSICDKLAFKAYSTIASKSEYVFRPLPIRCVLKDFLSLLIQYIDYRINLSQMCELKFYELFLLLRKFYDKEELSNLFHPVLGKSPDFKEKVIYNYQKVNNVEELAKKLGMSRTNLDVKFKKEFGMSPLQWMLKQKAKHIKFSMLEPENTLTDIMHKFNFNSPTHLNRFCKQQFGCSPSELRKKLNENG